MRDPAARTNRVEAVDVLAEAADQVDVAAARRRRPAGVAPTKRSSSSAIATPSRIRSSPARQVFCGQVEPVGAAVARVEPPADARLLDPHRELGEVVVGEAEPAPHRLRRGQVEHLASRSPGRPQARRGRRPARAGGWCSTSARSASRTRSRCAGCPSPVPATSASPNPAWTSGAYASMSGHITRMSRGSRVGSSASRPTSTSRSTSTWRAAPWHACTCTDRSPSPESPCLPPGRHPARSLARRSCCSQPSSVSAWSPAGGSGAAPPPVAPAGPADSVRCSSRASRPSDPSSGCRTSSAGRVLLARHRPGRRDDRRGRPTGAPETLWQPQVHVAQLAERAEQLHLGDRQTGVPEQRQPGRQVEAVTAAAQPLQRLGVADVGRRPTHPLHEAAPQLGLPQEVVVELVSRRRRVRPSRQSVTSRGRCTAYDAKSPARRRATE